LSEFARFVRRSWDRYHDYWTTEHGKIGYRFKVSSEADVDAMIAGEPTGPILKHAYEIAENRVEDGIRTVQANAI